MKKWIFLLFVGLTSYGFYKILIHPMKLYVATGNPHKITEFKRLMALHGVDFPVLFGGDYGGMPEVDENGDSYEANAQLKVEGLEAKIGEGRWIVAEDSGLEVSALSGDPGIYSARFGGKIPQTERNQLLLSRLSNSSDRSARFICCYCLKSPDGKLYFFRGVCEGTILAAPQGGQGFGYDPVFQPNGEQRSFAVMSDEQKDRISHRAMAFNALLRFLK
ncbi:MAG TPA: non-canonical purine NTP pyrophosphatase, RdgB/HAM1 family, partial [Opitutae bacterium]|nr:non-canonical purine NTP pyrophosphatase, RdgB/HAM1 family [Opitutae bacterium]